MILSIIVFFFLVTTAFLLPVCDPKPGEPANAPMGTARGVKPGRVSWFYRPSACSWDGVSGHYWDADSLDQAQVDEMVGSVVLSLTGMPDYSSSWRVIFEYFNARRHGQSIGYQPNQRVAIKANMNVAGSYGPTNDNGVSPQFMLSLLRQLVNHAGVPQESISILDTCRYFPRYMVNEPVGFGVEFPNVRVVDVAGRESYVTHASIPDPSTTLTFSSHGFLGWNTTLLPMTITEADYVIEINAFRGHELVGFTATAKNWFGSLYQTVADSLGRAGCVWWEGKFPGYWCPAFLHAQVNATGHPIPSWMPFADTWLPAHPMGSYSPLVDVLGHDDLSEKAIVYFTDGTYGGKKQDTNVPPVPFLSSPFDGRWSCSVFGSLDPVAMDSVMYDFLSNEPAITYAKHGCLDNYLHEAAQAGAPPSGTVYAPSGHRLSSLGVHEHWNSATDKAYSRNLGNDVGIELVKLHESSPTPGGGLSTGQIVGIVVGSIAGVVLLVLVAAGAVVLCIHCGVWRKKAGENADVPYVRAINDGDSDDGGLSF